MLYFPTALNLYWFTTNIISVIQGSLLRNKTINKSLGIGELKKWAKEDLPMEKVSLMKDLLFSDDDKKEKRDEKNKQKFDLDEVLKIKPSKPLKMGEKNK